MKILVRTFFIPAAAAGFVAAAVTPSFAQEQAQPAEEEAAEMADAGLHLPADSMELGARYVGWIVDYRADSLWARFDDGMKENFGSVGDLLDQMGEIFRQIGEEEEVISQRWWMRNGKPQFWHTAEFSEMAEPVVLRVVVEPDGTISGLGLNPQSQNPPVDDPEQHGPDIDP